MYFENDARPGWLCIATQRKSIGAGSPSGKQEHRGKARRIRPATYDKYRDPTWRKEYDRKRREKVAKCSAG